MHANVFDSNLVGLGTGKLKEHFDVLVEGKVPIYVSAISCEIRGVTEKDLRDELEEYLFQDKYIYTHNWEVGDVIIMDQLLTQHKRVPEKDEVLENRVLHRLSFRLTNRGVQRALEVANRI